MDKKRIFLLDDEKDMTLLTETLLTLKGFDVLVSNDPEEAVAKMDDTHFDVLVVDLMMPKLSGFRVIEHLRGCERHKETAVLVMSAKRLSDEERRDLLEWKVRFLPKPVTPSRLHSAIQEELAKRAPK